MIFIKLYIKKYLYTRKMNFKCNYCNKILASQSSLNVHLKRANIVLTKDLKKIQILSVMVVIKNILLNKI